MSGLRPLLSCSCSVIANAEGRREHGKFGSYDYIIVGAGMQDVSWPTGFRQTQTFPSCRSRLVAKTTTLTKIPQAIYTASAIQNGLGPKTEPEPGLNGRAIDYPRGKVLGGCSSINGRIYMRGQARLRYWAQLGNPGWGWDDVLPISKVRR